MRVLLPLLFIGCTACSSIRPTQPAPSEPRFHWESPGLFDPFVPSGEDLQLRNEGFLAVGSQRAFSLEYGRNGARAAEIHQRCTTDHLLDVVRWKKGLVWLRADKYGNLQLDADLGAGAEPFPRPDNAIDLRGRERGFPSWAPAPRLAADGEVLVLFSAPWIHRYEHDVWTSVQLDVGQDTLLYPPGRALLVGRKLWLGVDKGEWGGQLIVADIDTGLAELECRKWSRGPWNVTDIDRGSDGRIYVTCGVEHGSPHGSLMIYQGGTWTAELVSDGNPGELKGEVREGPNGSDVFITYSEAEREQRVRDSIIRSKDGTRTVGCSFEAFALDEDKRPCVLTPQIGILRRDTGGVWTWLTPGWPSNGAWVTDLAIVDKKAVITSRDAGVIVLDLDTLGAERVRLR